MEYEGIALILCLIISFISLISSFLTLLLIYYLLKWNGYLQLVISLTICQIIYDIAFFFLLIYDNYYGRYFYSIINMWGGITSSLWSNIIMFVTCQIIITLHSVNIKKNYKYYFIIVILPATIIGIMEGIYVKHNGSTAVYLTYFTIRSISVIFNIILFFIMFIKTLLLSNTTTNDTNLKFNSSNPVYVLSIRLIYYCVAQTLTRIGASWYQLQYGYGHNYHSDKASTIQTIAYFLEYILTPSAGIGYLIVFLIIQPEAYRIFCELCYDYFGCFYDLYFILFQQSNNNNNNDNNNNNNSKSRDCERDCCCFPFTFYCYNCIFGEINGRTSSKSELTVGMTLDGKDEHDIENQSIHNHNFNHHNKNIHGKNHNHHLHYYNQHQQHQQQPLLLNEIEEEEEDHEDLSNNVQKRGSITSGLPFDSRLSNSVYYPTESGHQSSHCSSSLFPLLDMDEDELAREIDKLYYFSNPHFS